MDSTRELLSAKIHDAFQIAGQRSYAKFTTFLNEDELYFAQGLIQRSGYENYLFFGGRDAGERQMLGAFPFYCEPDLSAFPIAAVTLEFSKQVQLSHRDFLGSLMGMRIKRDAVGDILPGDGWCTVYLRESVQQLVLSELCKVGRTAVKVHDGVLHAAVKAAEFEEVTGTVASLRLDAVIALVTRLSREKAAAVVQSGSVLVNHQVVQSNSFTLKPGDTLSVRGSGKFILAQQPKQTKRGRLFIAVNKYI